MCDSSSEIGNYIYFTRGRRIILSSHLALLYDVPVKRLNEQIKRNFLRFPDDFAFKLTPEEWTSLQQNPQCQNLKSQIATSSSHGGNRKIPWAFTEYGVIQAASVLNSNRAIEMSIRVVRAFVHLRQSSQSIKKLDEKLLNLTQRVDGHDYQLESIVDTIHRLGSEETKKRKKKIGFGNE
jgi:hypothetical protein